MRFMIAGRAIRIKFESNSMGSTSSSPRKSYILNRSLWQKWINLLELLATIDSSTNFQIIDVTMRNLELRRESYSIPCFNISRRGINHHLPHTPGIWLR